MTVARHDHIGVGRHDTLEDPVVIGVCGNYMQANRGTAFGAALQTASAKRASDSAGQPNFSRRTPSVSALRLRE